MFCKREPFSSLIGIGNLLYVRIYTVWIWQGVCVRPPVPPPQKKCRQHNRNRKDVLPVTRSPTERIPFSLRHSNSMTSCASFVCLAFIHPPPPPPPPPPGAVYTAEPCRLRPGPPSSVTCSVELRLSHTVQSYWLRDPYLPGHFSGAPGQATGWPGRKLSPTPVGRWQDDQGERERKGGVNFGGGKKRTASPHRPPPHPPATFVCFSHGKTVGESKDLSFVCSYERHVAPARAKREKETLGGFYLNCSYTST